MPGSLVELGISGLWGLGLSVLLGPIGWAIGFFTPALNTVVGFFAVEGFGGNVTTDGLTTNIQIDGTWGAISFGSVVLGDDSLKTYLPHEQGHYNQSLLLGPLYWLIIGLPSITWAGLTRNKILQPPDGMSDYDYYHSFYTEKWADAWQTKR
jgi:hypothetical protein